MKTTNFTPKESLNIRNGVNGNLSAMLYVQGRMACQNKQSIFDCPFKAGSDQAELWMDGFMFEEGKK